MKKQITLYVHWIDLLDDYTVDLVSMSMEGQTLVSTQVVEINVPSEHALNQARLRDVKESFTKTKDKLGRLKAEHMKLMAKWGKK